MEVAPGIHRIEAPLGDRFVCSYLFVGDTSALLMDTGLDSTPAEVLLPYILGIGVDPRKIRYILNTHADLDHFGGNASSRSAMPDAIFLCPELDRPMVEDLGSLIDDRYGEFEKDHGIGQTREAKVWMRANARATSTDIGVIGGEWIHLGLGWRLGILPTPGHTRGHVSVYDARSHAAVVGDAVLGCGLLTRDGLPASPPTYRYVEPYLGTIQRLEEMRIESLLTSHYPVYTGAAVAGFLGESKAFVHRLDNLLRAELIAARAPLTMRELIETLAPLMGDWSETEQRHLVYPLQGHLEYLLESGLAEVGSQEERVTWRWKNND